MKLKYLLIVNNSIDEIVHIFERDTPDEILLKYVNEFLKEEEWLDDFKVQERDPRQSLFEHYKYTIMEHFETHIAIVETELLNNQPTN